MMTASASALEQSTLNGDSSDLQVVPRRLRARQILSVSPRHAQTLGKGRDDMPSQSISALAGQPTCNIGPAVFPCEKPFKLAR